MKLASLNDGSRDGQLAVVSRDLTSAHYATGIAGTLQRVFDDWNFLSPQLEDLYATLNDGKTRHAFAFDPASCMAPLPRPFAVWRGTGEARLLRAVSGDALGAHDSAPLADCATPGATPQVFVPALAVVTGDVARGTPVDAALDAVRLLLLMGDWLPDADDDVASAGVYGPVAVTPDEIGSAWRGGRLHLQLSMGADARHLIRHEAAAALPRHFGEWIADAAAAQRLRAGSIVYCPSRSPAATGQCTADTVHLEALDADGASVFGAIRQRLENAA